MKRFFSRCNNWWEVFILFVVSLTPLWWLRGGYSISGHDSGFRLPSVAMLPDLFFSWNPSVNFGGDWTLFKGFLVTQTPETVFSMVFGFLLGQRIALVFWFFLIGISFYIFLRSLFPERERWVIRLWGSMFAMYNFYILQGWFIAERAKFSLFAALPLSLLLFYQVLVKKKRIFPHAVLFGMLFFFLNGGGSPPLYGAIMMTSLLGFGYFTFVSMRRDGVKKGIVLGIKIACVFFLMAFVLNAYWIVPQIELMVKNYASAVSSEGGVEGLMQWEEVIGKNASIPNLLRLQGIPDWYDTTTHAFSKIYLTNPLLIFASFVPALLVLFGIIKRIYWKEKERKHMLILLLVLFIPGLFFTAGSHPPTGVLYLFCMRYIPGFAIFRSSFYKFAPTVWIPMIVLSGYSVEYLIRTYCKKKFLAASFGVLAVLFILIYHFPFFVSDFFRFHPEFTTRVQMPSYVGKSGEYLKKNSIPDDRVLMVPDLNSGYYGLPLDTYTWGYFSLDLLPRISIDRPIVTNDRRSNAFIDEAYASLYRGDTKGFLSLTKKMGIRFILWRGDAKYNPLYKEAKSIQEWEKRVEELGIVPIFTKGQWKIYDLGKEHVAPMLRVETSFSFAASPFSSYGKYQLIGDGVVADKTRDLAKKIIYEPECIFCKDSAFEEMVSSISLPSTRHTPGTFLFDRDIKKESDALVHAKNSPAYIDALIAKANFRLSLYKVDHSEKWLNDYKDAMGNVFEELKKLSGKQWNAYAIRVFLFASMQKRAIPEVASFLDPLEKEIASRVWMTEKKGEYRYDIEIPEDGTYQVRIEKSASVDEKTFDDKTMVFDSPMILTKGYHRISLRGSKAAKAPVLFIEKTVASTMDTPPDISYERISPVSYVAHVRGAQNPFMMIFNQEYDNRFIARIGKEEILKDHQKIDGFANGWFITKTGDFDIRIEYAPQKTFYTGLGISVVSILCFVIVFLFKRKSL